MARDRAVNEAIKNGEVDAKDEVGKTKIRKSVPQVQPEKVYR